MGVRCDRCPTDVTATTQTVCEFDGCFWHGCPTCFPQHHESHPRLLGCTMDDIFANKVTLSDRSGNVSGPVDVLPIPPSEPSYKRIRPLARSIHATPSSVDVPTPITSTDTWKVTNASSSTISGACTLTSTSTVAILSVIPRSSLNHFLTKASTCTSGSCAVPSYHPPICCIPSCRTDAARNSRSRCVTRAFASTSLPRYSTRTWMTVITPTPNALSAVRGPPERLPAAPHS